MQIHNSYVDLNHARETLLLEKFQPTRCTMIMVYLYKCHTAILCSVHTLLNILQMKIK